MWRSKGFIIRISTDTKHHIYIRENELPNNIIHFSINIDIYFSQNEKIYYKYILKIWDVHRERQNNYIAQNFHHQ